jgi:pimeloyl-ACP methyl ester carboxylesterase
MTPLTPSGFLTIGDATLEYRLAGATDAPPAIVMLHEGLGSAALWGDFPDKLAAATGVGVFAYSRVGYGASSPVALPRPLTYMHDEAAAVLPAVLDAIGFRRGLLLGHSDGASIAAIYAGSTPDHRVRGLVLIAPHFIVEEVSVAAIRDAKTAYEGGDLKAPLVGHFRRARLYPRAGADRAGRERPVWHDPPGRDCADGMLLPGRGRHDGGRRSCAPARAAGRHARNDRGLRQPHPQAPPRRQRVTLRPRLACRKVHLRPCRLGAPPNMHYSA